MSNSHRWEMGTLLAKEACQPMAVGSEQDAALAAVGLARLELLQAEREARAVADERARLHGLLSHASREFAASLDLQDVLSAVTGLTVPEFADWCGIVLLSGQGELDMVAEAASDDHLLRAIHVLREKVKPSLKNPLGVGAVVRTNISEFYPAIPPEALEAAARSAGIGLAELQALQIQSAMVVPLPVRGQPIGALVMLRSRRVAFTELELRLSEDLALRAALAIENATRYALERQAADMLQRSLLPQELPQLTDAATAVRYLPGGAGLRIGGDWYDIIPLDRHRFAVVVGDVMGRGIAAAAVMGQLRSAVRAYTYEGHDPATVLTLVDDMVERLGGVQLTTCVYGIYDSATGLLCVSVAGHPPPLRLTPDGVAQFLDLPNDLPLGAGSLADAGRHQTTVPMPVGSTLLLYSDGLVEGRDQPVTDGMDLLQAAVKDWQGPPEALCDHVLGELGRDGHHDDDTALLVLAVGPQSSVTLLAHPAGVPDAAPLVMEEEVWRLPITKPQGARAALRAQLDAWGTTDPETAVYVAHELVANAVLHGRGPIELRVIPRGTQLRLEVADSSRTPPVLRHYTEDAFTGRGLALVEALSRQWGWQWSAEGKVVWSEVLR